MIITNEFILNLRSLNGGYSRELLAALGVRWPPMKGWKDTIIGTEISDERHQQIAEIYSRQNAKIEAKRSQAPTRVYAPTSPVQTNVELLDRLQKLEAKVEYLQECLTKEVLARSGRPF